ncbi:hypothetical protein ZWY2020_000303 [Hordeum vulgare]|nr:hypothetical protein ZWY2020_000303 [Hordeum vulgare]
MNSCDFRCNDQLYCNPGMQQARTMDDDGVMSAGQAAAGAKCCKQGKDYEVLIFSSLYKEDCINCWLLPEGRVWFKLSCLWLSCRRCLLRCPGRRKFVS